jgi:hypothetical protein
VFEGVVAEEKLVNPHYRAASKPMQEGFEGIDEEAKNLKISSPEYMTGATTAHSERKSRAVKKDTQSGVRELNNIY